jgi:hypothetical protein
VKPKAVSLVWRSSGAVAAIILLATGCRQSTAPLGTELTVLNATRDTLGYALVDLRAVGIPDRTPVILGNFGAFGGRVIGPAATTVVPVDALYGYPSRRDLSVMVYSVAKGMATYRGQFDVTRAQLKQRRFRIELSTVNLGE